MRSRLEINDASTVIAALILTLFYLANGPNERVTAFAPSVVLPHKINPKYENLPSFIVRNDKYQNDKVRRTFSTIKKPQQLLFTTRLNMAIEFLPLSTTTTETISMLLQSSTMSLSGLLSMDREQAEALAGPFFGASLFPYLAFLYFLAREENECPKGVTVGFATCLLFVFLTIPAAIAAQVLYGVSLADSDWLHGSAESLLTMTNLVTVVAFRQALKAKEQGVDMPLSATRWAPMMWLVAGLTVVAGATAAVPALSGATIHTPYLGGFMDLPFSLDFLGAHPEPDNALTVAWYVQQGSVGNKLGQALKMQNFLYH
jgi:hypothetical protein